jgi:hypothetical protein
MYKYNEDNILAEIKEYIDRTYSEHYASGKIQAVEFIVDQQKSLDYPTGNIIKYASRFGKKAGHNRKDLLKSIHYGIISLHFFDELYGPQTVPYEDEWIDEMLSEVNDEDNLTLDKSY